MSVGPLTCPRLSRSRAKPGSLWLPSTTHSPDSPIGTSFLRGLAFSHCVGSRLGSSAAPTVRSAQCAVRQPRRTKGPRRCAGARRSRRRRRAGPGSHCGSCRCRRSGRPSFRPARRCGTCRRGKVGRGISTAPIQPIRGHPCIGDENRGTQTLAWPHHL
jgi:hypothetical protein